MKMRMKMLNQVSCRGILLLFFLGIQVANSDRMYCARPECTIHPDDSCIVTVNEDEENTCPSKINPKLPDGGYRDLPGTPSDLKIERLDSTGEPILAITWKIPKPDPSVAPVVSFAVFIQAWDIKDSFKTKCLDKWYTVTNSKLVWPQNKSITLKLTCPFFLNKWLFVYVNSQFNVSGTCLVRQAHDVYKSTETPVGLPDYRVRLDPYGRDKVSVRFNPTPAVRHVVLWCNSSQVPVCDSARCQRVELGPGYGHAVFHDVVPCSSYSLKICPARPPPNRILYLAEYLIPASLSFYSRRRNRIPNIATVVSEEPHEPIPVSKTFPGSVVPWIVVGALLAVVMTISIVIFCRYKTDWCICLKKKLKPKRKKISLSSSTSDFPPEVLAMFTDDATPVPFFYFPDNQSHVDTVLWWTKRIQKLAGEDFNIQTYSVFDPVFDYVFSNMNDKVELSSLIFIVYSKYLFRVLPRRKLKFQSSPIKQRILHHVTHGRDRVFVVDMRSEKQDSVMEDCSNNELNDLLGLNRVIYLEEGNADESAKRLVSIMTQHQIETVPKKLGRHLENGEEPEAEEMTQSQDGGYYSGPKLIHADADRKSITSFLPPEIEEAYSERNILKRLEEINKHCSDFYFEDRLGNVDYAASRKPLDTLSV